MWRERSRKGVHKRKKLVERQKFKIDEQNDGGVITLGISKRTILDVFCENDKKNALGIFFLTFRNINSRTDVRKHGQTRLLKSQKTASPETKTPVLGILKCF